MHSFTRTVLLALLLAPGNVASAPRLPNGMKVDTLARGLAAPIAIEFLPDGRVLFAEQNTGQVRLFREGAGVQAMPVIVVPSVVSGGERGLLGIARDLLFPERPYLYVYYNTIGPSHIRIARFMLAGDLAGTSGGELTADPASRYDLLDDIPDRAPNHNGGTVRFGADGMLYSGLGDDAVPCAAQDSSGLRGVILRMDTSHLPPGPGAAFVSQIAPADNPFAASPDSNARLVIAMGLRNPFRLQADPVTRVIVIGDVGESLREELDVLIPPGVITLGPGAGAGANFGWPYLEGIAPGVHRNDCATPALPGLAAPVFDYDRTAQSSGAAIISAGSYWYTFGQQHNLPPQESGSLLASDYYSGALYRLTLVSDNTGTHWEIAPPEPGQPSPEHWGEGFEEISDWREGPDGALWFCRQSDGFAANTGSIGRIEASDSPSPRPIPPLSLKLLGSPAVGSAVFALAGFRGTARITLHDLSGRIVRTWSQVGFFRAPDGLRLVWDGLDDGGRAVQPGLYVARLEADGHDVSARVMFLR